MKLIKEKRNHSHMAQVARERNRLERILAKCYDQTHNPLFDASQRKRRYIRHVILLALNVLPNADMDNLLLLKTVSKICLNPFGDKSVLSLIQANREQWDRIQQRY